MEAYRMRMGHQGLPPSTAALPPLPPSRLSRNSSDQNPTPMSPSYGIRASELRPQWMYQSSDLSLNLQFHGGSGKTVIPEEVSLHALTKKEPSEAKQNLRASEKDDDPIMEAKRLKRIMQSRQYSQKYRLKQLHYISQLESEVKALQAEVTITSPRIKFIDRQNSLLRAENYSIKEKLTVYSGELLFKEAQYEELKREKNMLKEIYENYQLKLLESLRNSTTAGNSRYQLMNTAAMSQPENLLQKPADCAPSAPPLAGNIAAAKPPHPFSLLES